MMAVEFNVLIEGLIVSDMRLSMPPTLPVPPAICPEVYYYINCPYPQHIYVGTKKVTVKKLTNNSQNS